MMLPSVPFDDFCTLAQQEKRREDALSPRRPFNPRHNQQGLGLSYGDARIWLIDENTQ